MTTTRTATSTTRSSGARSRWRAAVGAAAASLLALTLAPTAGAAPPVPRASATLVASGSQAAAAATRPNVFFYNLDDLRDALPGGLDPLQYMPRTRQWMADGTRYRQTFVVEPSCCPSRSSLMTGRFPHNNGVRLQSQGPQFDHPRSLGCALDRAGYQTYVAGKFLTTWPKTTVPPCYDHSTVIWGGYRDVATKVDGKGRKSSGYSTTHLGVRGREYITQALQGTAPFYLYETPQAPHWAAVSDPDGTTRRAIPDTRYANAAVPSCSGVPEADRADKPAYVRKTNHTPAQAQVMCQSQLRAIMSADDELATTLQLLSDRGVLDDTLVIVSSDNGYMWGEHGRTEKFVPYEPAIRVPLLVRWPGHVAAGTDTTRLVSYLDIMPTVLEATGATLPAGSPPLDGQSLLRPGTRTAVFAEYWKDPANGAIDTWKMVRTPTAKYVQTYDAGGGVIFREYYDLAADPAENTNLLGDASTANDPPAAQVQQLVNRLNAFATCTGAACVTS